MRRVKLKRKKILSDLEEVAKLEDCKIKKRWRINIFRRYDARLTKSAGSSNLSLFVRIRKERIIAKLEGLEPKEEFNRITIAARESETDIDVPNYSVYTRPTAKPEFDKYFNIISRDSIKVTFKILSRSIVDAISGLAQKNLAMYVDARTGVHMELDMHPSYKADVQRVIGFMQKLKDNLDRMV